MRSAVTTLGGCLVAASLLLAGCGQSGSSNPYSLPSYDKDATGAARPVASPTPHGTVYVTPMATPPTAVKYHPADAFGEGAWVERGPSVAGTATQKAIVNAFVGYMQVRLQLSNTWAIDSTALAAVAAQQALSAAQERAVDQREANRHSIGRFVVNVSSVKVTGSSAKLTGCDFDGTSEVDSYGSVMEAPPGGVLVTVQLSRSGGSWRVVTWPVHGVPVCDWTGK